jgi:hypothetical protein
MFSLTITTDNAAFHDADEPGGDADALAVEVARILRWTAGQIAAGSVSGMLSDANGNTVGQYALTNT